MSMKSESFVTEKRFQWESRNVFCETIMGNSHYSCLLSTWPVNNLKAALCVYT